MENDGKNDAKYEIDDLSYIGKLKHSKCGNWQQYDVLLAARGYGWEDMVDWADYMANKDLMISKVSYSIMANSPETDITNEYLNTEGGFKAMPSLQTERGSLTVGGMSLILCAPVQIVWFNQTRVLRLYTITDDIETMTRYIETLIRHTFNTDDAMKLAKPVTEND